MTRKQDSAKRTDWKELMAGQEDFLRPLIQSFDFTFFSFGSTFSFSP